MKKISFLLFAAMALVLFGASTADSQSDKQASPNYSVKIIYFHGNNRCKTCNSIEAQSKAAVQGGFANELSTGQVKFETMNFEKKENKKYIKQFQLFSSSLIMIKYKDGKEVEWKNCQKVWELTDKESDFKTYVQKEVNKYLGKS